MKQFAVYSDSALTNLWPGIGMWPCLPKLQYRQGLGTALDEYMGPCGPGAFFIEVSKRIIE
jgi:hypothetical protein